MIFDGGKRIIWVNVMSVHKNKSLKVKRNLGMSIKKKRIAIISPLLPDKSGISYYTRVLMPAWEKYYAVEYFTDAPLEECRRLHPGEIICSYKELPVLVHRYDLLIYHMGNSGYHRYMYDFVQRYPGIMVMHDFYLGHLMYGDMHEIADREFFYNHGVRGIEFLHENGIEETIKEYPMCLRVINHALAVVCHSTFPKCLFEKYYGASIRVDVVPMPIFADANELKNLSSEDKKFLRKKLGIMSCDFVIASFGFIQHYKADDIIIEAIQEIRNYGGFKRIQLVFIGSVDDSYKKTLESLIKKHDKVNIRFLGFSDREVYADWMRAADIAIQLRRITRGETSATILDCLSYGLPVIANDIGPNHDYPDNVIYKIASNFTVNDVTEAVEKLINNPEIIGLYSNKGKEYVAKEHSVNKAAERYKKIIDRIIAKGNIVKEKDQFVSSVACLAERENLSSSEIAMIAESYLNDKTFSGIHRIFYCLGEETWQEFSRKLPQELIIDVGFEFRRCFGVSDENGTINIILSSNGEVFECPVQSGDVLLLERRNDTWLNFALKHRMKVFVFSSNSYLNKNTKVRRIDPSESFLRYVSDLRTTVKLFNPYVEKDFYITEKIEDMMKRKTDVLLREEGEQYLFVDLSYIYKIDLHTGIERVVNNIYQYMKEIEKDLKIIPTKCHGGNITTCFAYDYRNTGEVSEEKKVELQEGDIIFFLDSGWGFWEDVAEVVKQAENVGAKCCAIFHDLLPIRHSEWWQGSDVTYRFKKYTDLCASKMDVCVCDSKTTADDLVSYIEDNVIQREKPLDIHYLRMGSVFPVAGNDEVRPILESFLKRDVFLMVGTVEIRKNCELVMEAFAEAIKHPEFTSSLLIIGRDGWRNDAFKPWYEKLAPSGRILWLRDASDTELIYAYKHAKALINASKAEGFGLPIVEAAQTGLPLIISDISIFHEVAGDFAVYFDNTSSLALSKILLGWNKRKDIPDSKKIQIHTWRESAQDCIDALKGKRKAYLIYDEEFEYDKM